MEVVMRVPRACIIGLVAISLSVSAVAKSSGGNKQSDETTSTSSMRKAGGDPKSSGKPYVTQKSATGGAGAGKAKFNEFTIKKTQVRIELARQPGGAIFNG